MSCNFNDSSWCNSKLPDRSPYANALPQNHQRRVDDPKKEELKFDFEELKDIFQEDGLSALIAKLKELNIVGIEIITDAETRKTVVTANVDGVNYRFIGANGDTVTDKYGVPTTPDTKNNGVTNPGLTPIVPPITDSSNPGVEDLKNIG